MALPSDLVFGALNAGPSAATWLAVRVLDPVLDRAEVESLLAQGDFRERLAAGGYELAGPLACTLRLAHGPRRGFVRDVHGIGQPDDPDRIPIGRLGPTSRADVDALLTAGGGQGFSDAQGGIVLPLAQAEIQQMILRLTPRDGAGNHAFFACVEHFAERERSTYLGGFPYLFTA